AQDLSQQLSNPDLLILDARSGMDYFIGHLPGAVNISWKNFSNPNSVMRGLLDPDPKGLEQKLGALGVGNNKTIIVYADPFKCYGDDARILWTLLSAGHQNVRVLDGGWPKWRAEKQPIERGGVSPKPADFKIKPNPSIGITKEEVLERVQSKNADTVIIDSRTPEEYRGETGPGIPRGGHIPGAVNIPWNSFFKDDGMLKSPDEMRKVFEAQGVRPEKEVITYCTAGVRAAHLFFTLRIAGYPNVKNYPGSWLEWSNDSSLPVER
ncbi:MAG TPA: sulfurtransferase, partial [Nitrospiria bacterium]|nr:sulfurtransferase [Nitrospiria bacterium]